MTDMTNEIICECGHEAAAHGYYGCNHAESEVFVKRCRCDKSDVGIYRTRLSALQTEVEGRGETIARMTKAFERIIEKTDRWIEEGTVNNPPWWNLGDIAYVALGRKRPNPAATAPVEGEATNAK